MSLSDNNSNEIIQLISEVIAMHSNSVRVIHFCASLLILITFLSNCAKCDKYRIGVGIGDVTGPAADINMVYKKYNLLLEINWVLIAVNQQMGYAKPGQDTHGIHMRLYSRTAIIEDSDGHRICFVSVDQGMISQIVKLEVKCFAVIERIYHLFRYFSIFINKLLTQIFV